MKAMLVIRLHSTPQENTGTSAWVDGRKHSPMPEVSLFGCGPFGEDKHVVGGDLDKVGDELEGVILVEGSSQGLGECFANNA